MSLFEEIAPFNAPTAEERLSNLKKAMEGQGKPAPSHDVNNHIHTKYSFSPYSPTAAVYMARKSGLITCGIMDHDSVSGAREFIAAGEIAGMATTVGIECRVKYLSASAKGRRLNNPDQADVLYMALHGIPHDAIETVDSFFAPYRAARVVRDRAMVDNINQLLGKYDTALDYDRDVEPLSLYAQGGTVTERHISYALARKLMERFPNGADLVDFLRNTLGRSVSAKIEKLLLDPENPYLAYDLLGWIKSDLISEFYIPATDESPDIHDVLALGERVGAISAYPYLGDVGDSVTGDKKAAKFEDDFLPELLSEVKSLGFRAITYMPSRNTTAQLIRLRKLCDEMDFFQISGEDINTPRQKFICEAQRDPMFANLEEATWALIAHEWLSTTDHEKGLFSASSVSAQPDLKARVAQLAEAGRKMFL